MPTLNLKPAHKPIRAYYAALERFDASASAMKTQCAPAFQSLLEHCAWQAAHHG